MARSWPVPSRRCRSHASSAAAAAALTSLLALGACCSLNGGGGGLPFADAFRPLTSSNRPATSPRRQLSNHQCASSRICSTPALHSTAVSAASDAASSTTSSSTLKTTKKKTKAWFPVRPSDALPNGAGEGYDAVVRGAYLRHVALETEGATDLALDTYLRGGVGGAAVEDGGGGGAATEASAADPFGALARDLSSCSLSRDEGGKVGWVDNPSYSGPYVSSVDGMTGAGGANAAIHPMVPSDVVAALFGSRPKGGDVLKLRSDETDRWHLVRVDDLLVDYVADTAKAGKVGTQVSGAATNKVITSRSRSKLKGSGTTPRAPTIILGDTSDEIADDDGSTAAKTYHIATTGCQMNVADSERLAGVLQNSLNLKEASKPADADVVILNTCTIRDHAEQKVYDALGPYAARKRRGEPVAIVVAGCVAQQEGEALLRRVPEIDLVMGPQYTARLGDLLEGVGRGHQIVATDPTLISEDLSRPVRGHAVRAWVNIIHGCNEHCTYCVVPGVRGVEQSRSMEAVLEECIGLAEAGYKEVTLLGQNIDAYGRDMVPRRTFAELLRYLNDNLPEGTVERIRYVTSHPRYFSDRVIDAVADLDKVCECFHMPFQSGDDGVLKDMRRGYTFDSYMRIIRKIRERAPDASICGDVIVGFPGESDAAFQRTLDLMEAVHFDNLNTFAYSPRPNTEAALREDQVPDAVKAERLQIVQRLATEHALERSERYEGREDVKVLVEDRNPRDVGQVMGRTRQGRQVFFDGDADELRGKLVTVKIEAARPWSLEGSIVQE